MAPLKVSVLVPIFVRSPLPLITPAMLTLLPLVSNVPPPALSVTPRFEVKPARYCSVPPPKLSPPDVLPRLASVLTASVPALIVVPPLYVLVAVRVVVPAPICTNEPAPEMTPSKV